MTKSEEITGLKAKVELIDLLLDWHCKCELRQESRLYLQNLRYAYKTKIDELIDTDDRPGSV